MTFELWSPGCHTNTLTTKTSETNLAPCNVNVNYKDGFENDFTIGKEIASGHFAVVKLCQNIATGQEFAAKFVRKRRRGKAFFKATVDNEIRIHCMLSGHERFISLYSCYETTQDIILIMEYAKGGELIQNNLTSLSDVLSENKINQEKKKSTDLNTFQKTENTSVTTIIPSSQCEGGLVQEWTSKRIVKQVVEALDYLHHLSIVHLDIKPSNILLTAPLPHGNVKLCDFGLSRIISSTMDFREMVGTPDYVAPEVLNYDALSTQTDMWSLGVLTYVILTGHSPFSSTSSCSGSSSDNSKVSSVNAKNGRSSLEDITKSSKPNNLVKSSGIENVQETYLNITMGNLDFPAELFDDISPQAIDFISKLCVLHPKKRMTAKQALSHKWLYEADDSTPNNLLCNATISTINTEYINVVTDNIGETDPSEPLEVQTIEINFENDCNNTNQTELPTQILNAPDSNYTKTCDIKSFNHCSQITSQIVKRELIPNLAAKNNYLSDGLILQKEKVSPKISDIDNIIEHLSINNYVDINIFGFNSYEPILDKGLDYVSCEQQYIKLLPQLVENKTTILYNICNEKNENTKFALQKLANKPSKNPKCLINGKLCTTNFAQTTSNSNSLVKRENQLKRSEITHHSYYNNHINTKFTQTHKSKTNLDIYDTISNQSNSHHIADRRNSPSPTYVRGKA